MGGSPGTLARDAARAAEAGATELRLYHAGLASDADLGLVRAPCGREGGGHRVRRCRIRRPPFSPAGAVGVAPERGRGAGRMP